MKVLFIFAHPDDETFSSGGTIAKLAKKEAEVILLTATRGEAGLTGTPPVCKKESLGKVREQELRNAAKVLGISKIYFLDYLDGMLFKIKSSEMSGKILKILKIENPDIVVTFNKEGGSRHPDHIKISKTATLAFEQYLRNAVKHVRLYYTANPRKLVREMRKTGLSYTAFGVIKGTPDSQITTVIDVSETMPVKIKAIKCHRTQNKDWERFLKRREMFKINKEYFRLILENKFV